MHLRNIHNQLLIRITNELRLITKPLIPSFFDNRFSRAMRGLVKGGDLIKVDVLVQRELQCRGYVVRMVVLSAIAVMVMMMFVMAVRHVCLSDDVAVSGW